jgi:hypothetical protein
MRELPIIPAGLHRQPWVLLYAHTEASDMIPNSAIKRQFYLTVFKLNSAC